MARWCVVAALAACNGDDGGPSDSGELDRSACESGGAPAEVFLGRGVGGAFDYLEDGAVLGLSAAPQGGFGVSVLVGTRGLAAGDDQVVSAALTAENRSSGVLARWRRRSNASTVCFRAAAVTGASGN